jgi:type VI secretion system protein
MLITVKVLSYKGSPPVEGLVASFDQQGGTLGRSPENHFILSDPQKLISRKHAAISYENGCYYLQDTSTIGTFIYNKNIRVHQDRVQLDDGDKLRIGDYDLIVCIPQGVASHGEDTPCFWSEPRKWAKLEPCEAKPNGGDKALSSPENAPPTIDALSALGPENPPDYNFANLLPGQDSAEEAGTGSESAGVPSPPAESCQGVLDHLTKDLHVSGNLDSSCTHQDAQADEELVHGPLTGTPVPTDSPTMQEHRDQAYDELCKVFLEAAGIEDTSFYGREDVPELMRTVGALFREMIDGLVNLLRGRTALKTELRASVTTLKAVQNNPLKFSPILEETLKLLLTTNHPGFLDGVEAVREGYADIRHHQLALTAGVQAAVVKLLERFDPQQFAKHYAEGIVLHRKAKCWEAYGQAYQHIANEAHEELFGDAFVRAYEEQIRKLRSRDRKR